MKKSKILVIFLIVVVLVIGAFLINGFVKYKELNRQEENTLLGIFNYYAGIYETKDLNYTNVFDFSKKENGEISGTIYTFDDEERLIEEKRVYYYVTQEEATSTYERFKAISEDETSVTNITNVTITDNVVSMDINSDKSRKMNDIFENVESKITDNSIFLVIK